MAVDNSKLQFISGDDSAGDISDNIDKIIDFQNPAKNPNLSITVGSGVTTIITIPHSYGFRPDVIAQYNPSTQSAWFESGENLLLSTDQFVSMYTWARKNDIRFRVSNFHAFSVDVNIRYWVMAHGN